MLFERHCQNNEKINHRLSENICKGLSDKGVIQNTKELLKTQQYGVSLVAQWLGVCLPVWGTWVRALIWEDPACRGAAGPVGHNC